MPNPKTAAAEPFLGLETFVPGPVETQQLRVPTLSRGAFGIHYANIFPYNIA